MSDLFNYLFYTNTERRYYKDKTVMIVELCDNKLCGVLYGATYKDIYIYIYIDCKYSEPYWGSDKYTYYDGKKISTIKYNNDAINKTSVDTDTWLWDVKTSDIHIRGIIYDDKICMFDNGEVVSYTYIYENKRIRVRLKGKVDIYWDKFSFGKKYSYGVDINTVSKTYSHYRTKDPFINKNGTVVFTDANTKDKLY